MIPRRKRAAMTIEIIFTVLLRINGLLYYQNFSILSIKHPLWNAVRRIKNALINLIFQSAQAWIEMFCCLCTLNFSSRIPRGMRGLEFLSFGQTYSARRSILRRIGEGIYFFRYFRTENKLPNRPMPAPMGRSRRQSCLSTVRKGRVRMVISVKISPALVPK